MAEVVGTVNGIVRPDEDAVRPREGAFAPGGHRRAVALEDEHRLRPAQEDVDAILRIAGNADRFPGRTGRGELRPAFVNGVTEVAAADANGVHGVAPRGMQGSSVCYILHAAGFDPY